MGVTPVFVFEEHHEAFIVWHEAVRRGLLRPGCKNILLHVDTHADMKSYCLRSPVPEIAASPERVSEFVYRELIISSFIIPAVYQKLFYEVCWLAPPAAEPTEASSDPMLVEKRFFYVRSQDEDRKTLIVRPDPSQGFSDRTWEDRSPFCHYRQTTADPFTAESPVVLDIDLDYFCCSPTADAFERFEITEEEYGRCLTERYRKLNLHFRHYVEAVDGRYYLCFNPPSPGAAEARAPKSDDEIFASIRGFSVFLEHNQVRPVLIDICRSRYSGYTPEPAWRLIEKELLGELGRLYEIEVAMATE